MNAHTLPAIYALRCQKTPILCYLSQEGGKKGPFLFRKQNSNPTLSVVPHRLKWLTWSAGMGFLIYERRNLIYERFWTAPDCRPSFSRIFRLLITPRLVLTPLHPRNKGITSRTNRINNGRAGDPHTNVIVSGIPRSSDDKK